ncbi:hypothetical protein TNCT_456751 [Trichonephila clavata]|uniref:Uncharacterized protein n=1 Tax=Trichonephila clavata TaxID=2740835 RepID=A0A8X6HUD3_TRICU|nr:hypothetical protein TNCT_456751 [Trichonephila clavata]
MMPYNMPMPSQWLIDNDSAPPASNVEIPPNVYTEPSLNGLEMIPCSNTVMVPYSYMSQNIGSNFCGMFSPRKYYYSQQVIIL